VVRGGLIAVALALGACRTDPGALDRADLKAAIAADEALDRVLAQADAAEREGRSADAVDILKRKAGPAADDAITAADAVAPRSAWGRKEKKALVALEHDRKAELERYARALGGGDAEAKLAALKGQVDVEKRAKSLSEEIDRGP
jgi:hypothetical protein